MLISYNWLKRYIKEIPNEEDLINLITFKICELESVEKLPNGDTVFDMKILPDRAHDLLSHRGVAKEIAGILGIEFSESFLNDSLKEVFKQEKQEINENIQENLFINIQSPLCRRYVGRIVKGIEIGPSPKWMTDLLESVEQRSINNIVDITNFILFDIGQPIHAFDLDKLESPEIIVRNAKEGEQVELLGEKVGDTVKERNFILKENNLVISDKKDVLALAGVKGGKKAEVNQNTKNIIIEVANFDPVSIRKTARTFGIQTDAVKRYENELTPSICRDVIFEVSSLINLVCPNSSFGEIVDINNSKEEEKKVKFTTFYISKVLGCELEDNEIEKILKNHNYEYVRNYDLNEWEVIVPNNRLDITGPHDMAEEIGRVHGYEKIKPKIPELNFNHKDNEIWIKICLAKEKLVNDGYKEVITYTLTNKGEIEIMASTEGKNFLRTNLLDGLIKSYEINRLNMPLLDLSEIKIFEVGTIFTKDGEEVHVAYCDKKNKVEISLDEFVKNISDFSLKSYSTFNSQPTSFSMWSLYPFISRDISFWVPNEIENKKIFDVMKNNSGKLLIKEPYLFDKFTKGDKTSYAYRLVFQSNERTLKDEEVEEIMQGIYQNLTNLGFEIR